jgi:hypothetical protein
MVRNPKTHTPLLLQGERLVDAAVQEQRHDET